MEVCTNKFKNFSFLLEKILNKNLAGGIVLFLVATYAFIAISPMYDPAERDLHDFRIYYYAAKAYNLDLNPYDTEVLSNLAGTKIIMPYVYTPLVLNFFKIFAHFDYNTACILYVSSKVILVMVLLCLWAFFFLKETVTTVPWFLLFVLFSFNSPIYIDMLVGNVATFEQFILWVAFFFFIRKQLFVFCLLVVLSSLFKFTPLFFLFLLFVDDISKKKIILFGGSISAFVGLMTFSYFSGQAYYQAFTDNLSHVGTFTGIYNPTSYTIFLYIAEKIEGSEVNDKIIVAMYSIVLLSFAFGSFYAVKQYCKQNKIIDWRLIVSFFCISYAVMIPRFPDYAYILLIAPSWYALKQFKGSAFVPLIVLAMIQIYNCRLPGLVRVFSVIYMHYPLVIAYVIWGIMFSILIRPKLA